MPRTIEKAISFLKGNPDYQFESAYNNRQWLHVLYYRAWQILRGMLLKPFVSSKGLIFSGRHVRIEHKYQLRLGKNCIIGNEVHIDALSENGIQMGNNVTVARGATLVCTGVIAKKGKGIKIGNNCAIGAQSFLSGQGGIEIGDDVIMGPQVRIFSENHNYEDPDIPIRSQGESRKEVIIAHNCWVGAGVTILAGVTIGSGCVLAAGSVITKSFPPDSIVAGVPARVIKKRVSE